MIKNKLATEGKTYNLGDFWLGTFHHVALKLIKKLNYKYQSFEVLDENKQVAFISRHYYSLGLKSLERGTRRYKTINDLNISILHQSTLVLMMI